ncbi:EcoKI restriction-modification system protein HsdS [Myroides odoratus]|uniref:Restriction endonuclease subunit S n=2 Tax=Myroides odoratus TaxID=256 RepID=A0A9Q6Z7S5_MYROD|nr:restriction endonuclease subunit S [Myroides odoratus]EKB02344.1 hypothetical protein HMPREF9716_03767 [Myroides odoratus CIP 103059]EHQ44314.1 restriction modification system DNA specificity domain-containing protein [Myroides odoratus DSM 2801]EKB02583.1 hypothetical protein HMPREF9716_03751 [Myroides odoratus CIP 103059]QQU02002.1 restriction endonuclease subunit S [Myroides odoratus]SUA95733.1 EcoKI restriction-modification system protein HsdS [Myroides odoratus]
MTSKRLKDKKVPNLRFPEFEGEWETKKLREFGEINPKYKKFPSLFVYIDLESVSNGRLLKEEFINEKEAPSRAQRILEKGDILFQMVRPYQKNNLFFNKEGRYVASTGYAQIRTKQNPQFVFQYLHNQKFVDKVIERCTGTSYPAINSSDLGNIHIHYPHLNEQSKIASFLSLVDERIQTQNKIIEYQETLMLGVLTKIFTQKLKSNSIRTKEFPLWTYKKGGDIFYNCSNKKHNSDLPILAITQEYGAVPRDLIDHNITVTEKSIDSYKVVDKGDFIISLRSFQGGIEYSNYHGICSPAYIILKNSIDIVPEFYKHYLKSAAYIKLLNKKLEGIRDGKMISYNYFSEINLPYPCLEEQKYIADILTTIDNKIKIEKQMLNSLSKQRDYLLQQMFI